MVSSSEQGRRLKAAIAYSGKTDAQIAKAAGTSLRTLRRWKAHGFPNDADPRNIRAISNACGIPYAWFTADITQLWRIPLTPADEFTETAMEAGPPPPGPPEPPAPPGQREDDRD